MFHAKSFFDLCISQKCLEGSNCQNTLKCLYESGYRTIAINHDVQDTPQEQDDNNKKKKKGQVKEVKDVVPEPMSVDEKLKTEFPELMILKRLTITFASSDSYQKMLKSPNFKKYDILALLPTTVNALMYACSNVDADILAFDPETKSPLKINRKIYNQLMNKGYFFEILYSPTIEDQTKRRNTINMSHLYHTFGKSRNIIVSSGANHPIFIRSPYDLINLGTIFGLNEQQSKDSISHNPSNLYKKAVGRCHGKSIMFVENIVLDDSEASLIEIKDSDSDYMDVDLPALKKVKH